MSFEYEKKELVLKATRQLGLVWPGQDSYRYAHNLLIQNIQRLQRVRQYVRQVYFSRFSNPLIFHWKSILFPSIEVDNNHSF